MKITVLDGWTLNPGDLSWAGLEELGEVTVYDRTPPEMILQRAKDAEIILTNKTPLRASMLDRLPSLKYVGVLATGYDVVDWQACAERGIVVTNVPDYSTDSVAQFVFALLLELCHQVGMHSESARAGEWSSNPDFCYWRSPLVELSGKTLGVIGLGRIGQRTAEIALAFGMNVIGYTRSGRIPPEASYIQWADLETLLRTADVVSLHCPLTDETRGMIDRSRIGLMKRSAFLINTARGPLICEQDLADALNEGSIAGAAVDVLTTEPPPADSPLLHARNCIVTPHIAWAAREARVRLMNQAVDNVKAFLAGNPVNVVGDRS